MMDAFAIKQHLSAVKRKLTDLESSQQYTKELTDFQRSLINVLDEILDGMDEIQNRLGPEIRP